MDSKTEKILAFIEERIEWNVDMMKRDPKPSDIGRIEEAKCIRRFIESLQEEPVSEDLEEAAIDVADNDMQGRQIMEASNEDRMLYSRIFRRGFKVGAEWQKEKHERQFSFINLKDCKDAYNEWKGTQKEPVSAAVSWIRACRWQKVKDQSTIELAEDHAMLAGMEKMREQMMKDAVGGYVIEDTEEGNGDFLLSADYIPASMGLKDQQKVKVIILKDE
jgi:hypothetical protein